MLQRARGLSRGIPRYYVEFLPFVAALAVIAIVSVIDPATVADALVRILLATLCAIVAIRLILGGRERDQALLLERLSRIDALTGLLNQGEFHRRLEEEIVRARRYRRRFGLIVMDVDGLKRVNDEEGHLRGDEMLGAFGQTLLGALRASDLGFRIGGDEFAALLPETDREQTAIASQRIRDVLLNREIAQFGVTVSLGTAEFPTSGMSAEELMRNADRAMYAEKALTRQRRAGPRDPSALPPEYQPDPRRAAAAAAARARDRSAS